MSTTAKGLAIAWFERAQRAATLLEHMRRAPALFKPEYVAETEREYAVALRWMGYWRAQAES